MYGESKCRKGFKVVLYLVDISGRYICRMNRLKVSGSVSFGVLKCGEYNIGKDFRGRGCGKCKKE